jgi:uncharacterized repeat protein (TIGR01451 family)
MPALCCIAAERRKVLPDGKDAIMTRRFKVLAPAFVLGVLMTGPACGQSSSGSMSLAERMAALRRGLAPGTQNSDQRATSENKDRSLVPNWFKRGEEQPPADSTERAGSRAGAAPRTTSQPGASTESTAQAPLNRGELPGLGGSPLPQGKWAPSRHGAAARGNAFRELSSDYPVIRDVTSEKSAGRQQTAPPTSAARSSTRHSPGRHVTPRIDPDELRRELAGSFSASGNGAGARTAQADSHSQEPQPVADTPLVLPPIEEPAQQVPSPPRDVLKIEQPQPQISGNKNLPRSAAEAFGATPQPRSSLGIDGFTRAPRSSPAPLDLGTERGKEAFGEALQVANGGDPAVLVSNQTPIITADIRGPKQIMIGREAVYRVRLQNQGAAPAEGIVATVRIPPWADVVDSVATQGTVRPSQNAATPTQLEWQLTRIDGRATETLDVRLVPRESRPLELGISWTIAPVGSRAIVEVQEPLLKVEVDGPSEVLYARPQVFRLTLSNPGTGPAENVQIELVPPGGKKDSATTHPVGTLQPNESKTVEIELTARDAGKLQIKAIASAEGGLTSEVAKEVFCRKPELEVDWRGSATQYAGTAATYFFRVRNPGTAPAEDVAVKVTLPEGAEFTSASEGQVYDSQRGQVTWQVGTLGPGDDNYMELKCVLKKPGVNQFQLAAASTSADLTDSTTAETNVIALADLKLDVSDPSGAVAVGSPATYEIRVANRGASAAKNVTIVALFSEGIEPDQAEGAMYTVADGRVAFRPIEELPAGREIVIQIRAHALRPGTHVFRAEVLCSDAEIKLAAEETTRFYADDVPDDAEKTEQQEATRTSFESAAR